jgi:UDP-N-acetylmuramate dehydrogenase
VPGLQYAQLRDAFPDLPAWPQDGGDQVKLSAAWLIEQAGMKGHRLGDAGISERHALVVVNHGRASGRELWALAQQVRNAVEARFGVRLEPEPRVIAAR